MADVFKGLGHKVTIYDRFLGETKAKMQAALLGQKIEMTVTQKLSPQYVHIKNLRDLHSFYRLKHLAVSDFRFVDLPIMHTPSGYPPFPDTLSEALDDADMIFTDGEYLAWLPTIKQAWGDKAAFYVHWPLREMPPVKDHPFEAVLCNSEFTKRHVKERWGIDATVFYPPVYCEFYDPSRPMRKREYDVVCYARLHADKFARFEEIRKALPNLKFAVMGSSYGLKMPQNVDVFENATLEKVCEVLGNSKLYLHLKGLEPNSPPEHFGQTVVEAIASGCMALAPNAGGTVEIPSVRTFIDYHVLPDLIRYSLTSPKLEEERLERARLMRAYDPSSRKAEFDGLLSRFSLR
jgi:glycosyltransferase involved in cell wall biosynthesis